MKTKIKIMILRFLALCLILSQLSPCAFAEEPITQGQWNAPTVTFAGDGADTFAKYVAQTFARSAVSKKAAVNTGSRLTGVNAKLYACLKKSISQVADGTLHSTVFYFTPQELGIHKTSFTAQELGISAIAANNSFTEDAKSGAALAMGLDLRSVLECLMADLPYELYWFDKVSGAYEAYAFTGNYQFISVDSIGISMYVSVDYAAASTDEYWVQMSTETKSDLSNVALAAKNAKEIVKKHADETDYQKLMSYIQEINSLTAYNMEAATDSDALYTDPWELIYVFDGDPNTTVVCEGYSKAMQYLCDMSEFQGDIVCYSVMGNADLSSGGAGGHMWNVIHMDDGKNYLVDVTNYKSMDSVFCGVTGSVEDGYTLLRKQRTLHYEYYDQSLRVFTKEELTLSAEDYPVHTHNYTAAVVAPTCTEPGYTVYTCDCGDRYTDAQTSALGHDLAVDPAIPATCIASGLTEGSHCTRCDYHVAQQTVEALGHDLIGEPTVPATCTESGLTAGGYCSRCDYYSVQQTVPALGHDLAVDPAVPATCIASGLTEGSHCTRCDYAVKGQVLPPLGHSYEAVVTAPSCTEDGVTVNTCTRCGDSYEEDRIAALGHSYRGGVCTQCGEKEPVCMGDESCPGHLFADMPQANNWAHKGIDYCISKNLMNGMSEGVFQPSGSVTRAQIVTILYRIAGSPEQQASSSFKDVVPGRFYSAAVTWASDCGIVTGYTDGTFSPNGLVTREQLAAFIYRYAAYYGYDTKSRLELAAFPDASAVSGWAKDALSWAGAEGLITGIASGGTTCLKPRGSATRAQVATILMRFLETIAE